MSVKRTFVLNPQADRFLSQFRNKSQLINELLAEREQRETERQLEAYYREVSQDKAYMDEFREWEGTLMDGLEEEAD